MSNKYIFNIFTILANARGNAILGHLDTLLLIDQYKLWEPKIKKKLWQKIAEMMQMHNTITVASSVKAGGKLW